MFGAIQPFGQSPQWKKRLRSRMQHQQQSSSAEGEAEAPDGGLTTGLSTEQRKLRRRGARFDEAPKLISASEEDGEGGDEGRVRCVCVCVTLR